MKRLFFLFTVLVHLSAQTPIEEATSTFSKLPSWTVADCVSPISGQYFISENDLVVRGAQPLPLPRNYLSLDQYGKGGWSDRNHLLLKARKVGNNYFYFSTHDVSGIPLIFGDKHASKHHAKKFYLNREIYEGTLLNTAIGEVGGRTNLKNAYADFSGDACRVHMPDGTVRIYGKKLKKTKSSSYIFGDQKLRTIHSYRYCLTEERLPNGNRIFYSWTTNPKYTVLKSVYSSGPRKNSVYAVAIYNDDEIVTSDGRKERKGFEEGQRQIASLEITGKPKELFTYTDRRMSRRAFSEGPYVEITYNEKKIVPFENEDRSKGKNYREWGQKVVWPSNTVKQIANSRGVYQLNYKGPSSDITKEIEAIDPEGGKTLYQLGKKKFPKRLIYTNQKGEKTREIEYEWAQGNLLSLTYKTREGKPYKTVEYEYDNKHNITKEILRGDHRGFGGCEKSVTEYQYNAKHLPIFKKDPSGKITRTTYWKETALPASILTGDSEKIYKRQFFTYNEDYILIQQIRDDGASEDPENLKEVTTRKIRRIKPHRAGESSTKIAPIPALNLPEEIADYYYDSKKQKEILLKKKH
ncbi:MAG: hypothetical protein SNF33_02450 [Candidatus Algichlamydia australiensis]|nr:hypothetical protein [Chlamydiales bacterium]